MGFIIDTVFVVLDLVVLAFCYYSWRTVVMVRGFKAWDLLLILAAVCAAFSLTTWLIS